MPFFTQKNNGRRFAPDFRNSPLRLSGKDPSPETVKPGLSGWMALVNSVPHWRTAISLTALTTRRRGCANRRHRLPSGFCSIPFPERSIFGARMLPPPSSSCGLTLRGGWRNIPARIQPLRNTYHGTYLRRQGQTALYDRQSQRPPHGIQGRRHRRKRRQESPV